MKNIRLLILISVLTVFTLISTACSNENSTLLPGNNLSKKEQKEKVLKEKTMTLSIGEKIQKGRSIFLDYGYKEESDDLIVFTGFPNEKNLAFTMREGHEYTSIFLPSENTQPFYISKWKLTMIIEKVDYQKGTVTVKLVKNAVPNEKQSKK